ncbi:MAG TPA: TIR domain-containing protein [Aggregatilineales bacterium]|nr:TIR domain-containing protein [Aggregatilineales bacterium]
MAHIYLSYSREDSDAVRRLQEQLQKEGLKTWTDESLTPDTPAWRSAIDRAIEGAECLVVVLSPAAREASSVKTEIDIAQKQGLKIFPVLAGGDEKSAVPSGVSTSGLIDLRGEANFESGAQKLATGIRRHMGIALDSAGSAQASAGSRRNLYIGAVVALIIVVVAIVVLMGGGDEDEADTAGDNTTVDASADTSQSEDENQEATDVPPTAEPILCSVPVSEEAGADAMVRGRPATDGTVITTLSAGDMVDVYGFRAIFGTTWLNIEGEKFDGRQWMAAQYVEAGDCPLN